MSSRLFSSRIALGLSHRCLSRRLYSNTPQYVRFSNDKRPPNFFSSRTWPIKVGAGFAVLGGVYYVSHLEQVPETGRWRFINVSAETEGELEKQVRLETLQQFRDKILPPDHPISVHVRRVATKIITSNNLGVVKGGSSTRSLTSPTSTDMWNPDVYDSGFSESAVASQKEWNVIVINDSNFINAFASPGMVVVSTGILPVCRDEQGLAAVLGHEIGHVALRHSVEKISSMTIVFTVMVLLAAAGVDLGLTQLMGSVLHDLPNSRMHEREADIVGLRLMSRACYDPKASPEVFARLQQIEGRMAKRMPQFLQTHPSSENRVKYLEKMLPEAYDILAASPDCGPIRDRLQGFKAAFADADMGSDFKDKW